MKNRKKNQLSWLWLSILVVIADQVAKTWVSHLLNTSNVITLLPHLNFIIMHNSGAAFSFLGWATGWQRWLFVAISFSITIYLFLVLRRADTSAWVGCAISLIIGGALSNLYDRLFLGYVIDFIDLYVRYWHFATFNLADSAISIGALMWIISSYKKV